VAQRNDDRAAGRGRRGRRRLARERPGRVGAHTQRRGSAGGREPRGGLVVAQDQQVGGADDDPREPARGHAVQVAGADADERQGAPGRLDGERDRRGAGEERERRAPAGRVQPLEDGAAGEHDRVGGAHRLQHRADVVARDGRDAVLPRRRGGIGRRRGQRRAGERACERGEQRLVARVALAERAGQQHVAAHRHRRLRERRRQLDDACRRMRTVRGRRRDLPVRRGHAATSR
jgi:hypothetical protein